MEKLLRFTHQQMVIFHSYDVSLPEGSTSGETLINHRPMVLTLPKPQFVTMDAIANVYYPLVMAKPVLIIYFLPLLMCLASIATATDETICCGHMEVS